MFENATDNRKRGEASPTSHRRGAGVVAGILDTARGTEGETPSAPAHLFTKEQLEAGAEVICDATGWPIVDCDYVMKLITDALMTAQEPAPSPLPREDNSSVRNREGETG